MGDNRVVFCKQYVFCWNPLSESNWRHEKSIRPTAKKMREEGRNVESGKPTGVHMPFTATLKSSLWTALASRSLAAPRLLQAHLGTVLREPGPRSRSTHSSSGPVIFLTLPNRICRAGQLDLPPL